MPLIRISHAAQYQPEQKENIMKAVTQAYAQASGCEPAKVWVLLEEVSADDWATGGTSLAARRQGTADAGR